MKRDRKHSNATKPYSSRVRNRNPYYNKTIMFYAKTTTHGLDSCNYFFVVTDVFLTTITISFLPLDSNDQSNLSPGLSPHCFTMNIGIVVRSDALFGAFSANVVNSPILIN